MINDVIISVANHALPFGGAKFSGIGRYHGEGGLRIFCHEKAIIVDAGKRKTEVFWFPYKDKYPLLAQLLQSLYGKRKNWIQFIKSYIGLVRRSQ
nr:hypothetical protein [Caldalkalibacillus mannanilyticus]